MDLLPNWEQALDGLQERLDARTIANADGCMLWQGAITGKKYPAIRFQGKLWAIHRLLMTIDRGAIPEGYEVDHACFNMLCVNRDHLRVITVEENRRLKDPRKRGHKGGRSGEWGVYPHKYGFQVHIKKEGKSHLNGVHKTLEDAVAARNELVQRLWPLGLKTPVQTQ